MLGYTPAATDKAVRGEILGKIQSVMPRGHTPGKYRAQHDDVTGAYPTLVMVDCSCGEVLELVPTTAAVGVAPHDPALTWVMTLVCSFMCESILVEEGISPYVP